MYYFDESGRSPVTAFLTFSLHIGRQARAMSSLSLDDYLTWMKAVVFCVRGPQGSFGESESCKRRTNLRPPRQGRFSYMGLMELYGALRPFFAKYSSCTLYALNVMHSLLILASIQCKLFQYS